MTLPNLTQTEAEKWYWERFEYGTYPPYYIHQDAETQTKGMSLRTKNRWEMTRAQYHRLHDPETVANREKTAESLRRDELFKQGYQPVNLTKERAIAASLALHEREKAVAAQREAGKREHEARHLYRTLSDFKFTKENALEWESLFAEFCYAAGLTKQREYYVTDAARREEGKRLLRSQEGFERWGM